MKYNPASHWLEFWFVLKGKAGSPGERGPPGKPVSIVYLVVIFLLNFSHWGLIMHFILAGSITMTTADNIDL